MLHYPERPASQSVKLIETFRETFRARQESLKRGQAPIRVPQPKHLYERQRDMAYHFKPELFVQTGGATLFRCPEEELLVRAPEICIMPMGVPHHETVENLDTPFENVVVCFYSKTVTVHLARADESMTPRATDIFFYQTPYFSDLVSMLNLSAGLFHSTLPDSKLGLQGVMMGVFSLLLNMIATEDGSASVESQRVYRCQWLIRNHLQDPELSVQWLADSLGCSSNYLSKLFHDELGEKVTNYIMRIRLDNALFALRDTTLSVKEIALACGFRDPNYFSRVFRQRYEMTPKDYRQKLVNESGRPESQPKLVRGDHEEYHYGYDEKNRPIQGNLRPGEQ